MAIAGLARGLRELGHGVDVLRPRTRDGPLDLARLLFNLGLPRRVAALAKRYDLVVGFDFDGWRLPRDRGFRYVVCLKGVAADERRFETGVSRLRFGLASRMEGRNARSADRVFVTSRYQARVAAAAYGLAPDRIRIAPEAVDDDVLRKAAEARREGPPLHLRELVILSVARQYRRKDTPTLLRAFGVLLERVPAARLRIVGGGPELDSSRRLAASLGLADRVTFAGSLASTGALDREYRRARVFCLPSRQEGFGIVFLEAMAYGLPIAAAAAGAVPEVAPHDETSLLVEPGDARGLADALARLLSDRRLAARLGDNGAARAARHDWRAAARAFLSGLEG